MQTRLEQKCPKRSEDIQEVEYSQRVLEAFEKAKAEGRGATQLDGKLVENVHVAMAQRILKIAEITGLMGEQIRR
jgi:citrate lyase beta subunit